MTDSQTATTTPANDRLKWYVVHTYSGFENKVKTALDERVKQLGLQDYFGEVLIPVETVEIVKTEEKNGKTITKKRSVKRKFAPGYIFVHMEMKAETWQAVKNTPKVTGFIGAPNLKSATSDTDLKKIPPVPERQVKAMTEQLIETAVRPAPKIEFEIGDAVRVVDGNFVNFSGTVAEVNIPKQKVKVLITIFGRSQPVALDFSQVAKAGGADSSQDIIDFQFNPDLDGCGRPKGRWNHSGVENGKEDYSLREAAVPGWQGQPGTARRTGPRPARREHHGFLQGVQRAHARPGWHDHPRLDHRVLRQVFHLHHEDAPGVGAPEEGRWPEDGQEARRRQQDPRQVEGWQGDLAAMPRHREDQGQRHERVRCREGRQVHRRHRPLHGRRRRRQARLIFFFRSTRPLMRQQILVEHQSFISRIQDISNGQTRKETRSSVQAC